MAGKEGHRLGNRFKRKSRRLQIEGCVGESGGGPEARDSSSTE